MEGEPELPVPPAGTKFFKPNQSRPISINHDVINLNRSFNTTSSFSSTTSSSSTSPPEFVRHVQAAFKRQRPIGTMQFSIKPRRCLVAQRETSKETNTRPPAVVQNRKVDVQRDHEPKGSVPEVQRKVSIDSLATSRGVDDRMDSGSDDLLPHMDSLAVTENERDVGDQVHTSAVVNQDGQEKDWKHYNCQSTEIENRLRYEGGSSSLLARKALGVLDQQHQLGNFLQKDLGNVVTQSSVVGPSCVTSTIINSTSAPRISSTTYSAQLQTLGTHVGTSPADEMEVPLNVVPLSECFDGAFSRKPIVTSQVISSSTAMPLEVHKSSDPDTKSLPAISGSDVKVEKLETGGTTKVASTRKRGYDPESFFKVNGKFYQRLGKIGSGGSSEVHKVISSDCQIYALKKIKLKGRDYATAFGFCQEIEYLNRLKGKNNIIQLIDYEVTDKTLLQEVMNGSMSNNNSRVKQDGYIYMVLEYGEIDLAHMLSHKWKELDGSTATIDENWLRFYWQQILLSVNTIHEERIVHSDLKPANFLLVRGSLKLIDFGIAKAIMSDTTNIQRDSQVGTLSYMSPEAFMCNETDANGNMIKCGRPSDIWSLGCILYQMVYGRTPFSEYKTFWAKLKVITDPNHEIIYEPVSNPWLLDLMRKCLAWDRNERWKIPELLKHPFIVPPVPLLPNLFAQAQSSKLLQQIKEASLSDQKALNLYSQLQSMLMEPGSAAQPDLANSKDQLCDLLRKISTIYYQLQEQLASS